MAPEIPPQRLLDYLTRTAELLALNLEATRKLTGAIERFVGVIPPPAPPAPILIRPAPPSLAPLADRIDRLVSKLDTLKSSFEEYQKREKGKLVALVNQYSGSDQAYQTLVTWKIGDLWGLRRGRIEEVSFFSNNFSKTRFRLTVAKTVLFKDLEIQRALTLPFPEHETLFGEKVTLEVKSSDGTNITVDGSLTGKEF